MMEDELDVTDLAFLREAEQYVNKWVAILKYGSDDETIVSSGDTIREARETAEALGFRDLTFLRIPPIERIFVPANWTADTTAT